MSKKTIILAIETSCDETAVSVVASSDQILETLSNEVSSQVKLHAKWGGVVPNLAAREHVKNIDLLLKSALKEADVSPADIDAIAVTQGPGLIPALLVGVNYAKTLSYLWGKPLIPIHHIEGHIYANFIKDKISVSASNQETNTKQIQNSNFLNPKQIQKFKSYKPETNEADIKFPILCLVVSGGHTQLILMRGHLRYEIIGQTVDDAVGEAFDKVARILGIGYPGGPGVARWANKFQETSDKSQTNSNNQISNTKKDPGCGLRVTGYGLRFPRPMLSRKNFDFSFSGLKTAVLYEVKKFATANGSSTPIVGVELPKEYIAQVCHEFQQACVDVLVAKTIKAAEKHEPKSILLAGGVSANKELRRQLGKAISKNMPAVSYHVPDLNLTGDNAAMIGAAASFRWQKMTEAQKKSALGNWKTLQPNANLKMQSFAKTGLKNCQS